MFCTRACHYFLYLSESVAVGSRVSRVAVGLVYVVTAQHAERVNVAVFFLTVNGMNVTDEQVMTHSFTFVILSKLDNILLSLTK